MEDAETPPEQPTVDEQAIIGDKPPRRPIGQPRGLAFVIILWIVTLGFYGWYWAFKTFDEMRNYTNLGMGGVLGLVLQILVPIVNWFVAPYEVREMYEGDGEQSPVRGWTGLWVLLPFVGWFVWIVKVQRALNSFWESRGAVA